MNRRQQALARAAQPPSWPAIAVPSPAAVFGLSLLALLLVLLIVNYIAGAT
jgi:hypothetical protein